jgi:hypothetical protein
MDALVDLVVKKTGLPEVQARQAVTVVIDYLKEKLPMPIAAQVDGILNNDGLAGVIGGLFG